MFAHPSFEIAGYPGVKRGSMKIIYNMRLLKNCSSIVILSKAKNLFVQFEKKN